MAFRCNCTRRRGTERLFRGDFRSEESWWLRGRAACTEPLNQGPQLGRSKGFGQVPVGTRDHAVEFIAGSRNRGDHQDRDGGEVTELPGNFATVHVWKAYVESYQSRAETGCGVNAVSTTGCGVYVEPLFGEDERDQPANVFVIFDDQAQSA